MGVAHKVLKWKNIVILIQVIIWVEMWLLPWIGIEEVDTNLENFQIILIWIKRLRVLGKLGQEPVKLK